MKELSSLLHDTRLRATLLEPASNTGSDLSLGRDIEQEQKVCPTPKTGLCIILPKERARDENSLFCSEYLQISERAGGEIPGKP